MKAKLFLLATMALLLTACEKAIVDEQKANGQEAGANLTIRFRPYQQSDFATRSVPIGDLFERVSIAIFKTDGTKVKSITQKRGDAGFGEINVQLEVGTYKVVAVAHNGDGTATITSTEKVTFPSNKMTDTFSCCETVELGEEPVERDLILYRVVAMVQLTVTGTIPDNVAQMKFYYTGGSSTLNPSTGYGCVNSKQTEYRQTVVDGEKVRVYELYTAPHTQDDVLKMTITAQGSDGTAVNEWVMEDVPVTKNMITTWEGSLFGGSSEGEGGITIELDADWDGTVKYNW
jgi:hypothetical protein